MEEIFKFLAQPELGRDESLKAKPLDTAQVLSGLQNESGKPSEVVVDGRGGMADSYGPWMHVSYGRFIKNNNGQYFGNKKPGNMGNYGKARNNSRNFGGPPVSGAGKIGKAGELRKGFGKSPVNKEPRIQVVLKKDGVKNLGALDSQYFLKIWRESLTVMLRLHLV
ncbi:hypothetical protein QYF36_017677 [Acer negundo]|nr:hypothetical protein QYF36_017677 [Acer negundo]